MLSCSVACMHCVFGLQVQMGISCTVMRWPLLASPAQQVPFNPRCFHSIAHIDLIWRLSCCVFDFLKMVAIV